MKPRQLLSHVDTDLVTREQLRRVAAPEPTRTFQPIPHIELVEMLDATLRDQQISIREEQFALRRDGSVLFGVLQLAYGDSAEGTAALGLRTANNKTMAIQICAGLSVFVCDNLAFRGDMIALRRKHTSGLQLRVELAGAVLRFQEHFGRLSGEVERLKERTISDIHAKALIHDAFAKGIMPLRFLPAVSGAYFVPQIAAFEPRTAWSLHNAFTGVAKDMPMSTRLEAIQALGRMFGMSTVAAEPAIWSSKPRRPWHTMSNSGRDSILQTAAKIIAWELHAAAGYGRMRVPINLQTFDKELRSAVRRWRATRKNLTQRKEHAQ